MITQRTVLDQVTILRNGLMQIRFGLLLEQDGQELSCNWHRTAVEPGTAVDEQMAAVNSHLQQMGRPECPAGDLVLLRQIAAVVHTPAVVQAYRNRQAGIRP